MLDLPPFPDITQSMLESLAKTYLVSMHDIVEMPAVGITNKLYAFGKHLVLRVPRDHPKIIGIARKEAQVVPIVHQLGVRTPRLIHFDETCTVLPVPFSLYERVRGATLEPLNCEPVTIPDVWRALGRDLALVHTGIQAYATSLSLVDTADDISIDPHTLADAGYFTGQEARWLERWLDHLTPMILPTPSYCFIHGDSQATNLMVDPHTHEYVAVLDWGSCGWGDDAWDFAGIPLGAVPYVLEGHRAIAPLTHDETAEARILWRHLQIGLWLIQRDPQPQHSWAERPLAMFLEIIRFMLNPPDERWRNLLI